MISKKAVQFLKLGQKNKPSKRRANLFKVKAMAMKKDDRKIIRGKGWKRTTSIALDKYTVISSAILEALTTEPMSFSDVVHGVRKRVKSFSGSIAWYTITCLRELESQKKIIRHKTKPIGYSKKSL